MVSVHRGICSFLVASLARLINFRKILSQGTGLHGISGADRNATTHLNLCTVAMMLTAAHVDSMTTPNIGKLFQHREDGIYIYIQYNIYIYIHSTIVRFVSRSYSPTRGPHLDASEDHEPKQTVPCMDFWEVKPDKQQQTP